MMVHDDFFVVLGLIINGVPWVVWAFLIIMVLSIFLTYVKLSTQERQRREQWIREHPDLPEICTFPMCGKPLKGIPQGDRVQSKMHPAVFYCSRECRRRDTNENNHRSLALLLKYRSEELEGRRRMVEAEQSKGILDLLGELVPNPQGGAIPDPSTPSAHVPDRMAEKMEYEAAILTARRFVEGYVERYGLAVHHWAWECHARCGRGAVLIHLSEKALEHSSGSPLTYIPQRVLLQLDDYILNDFIRRYDPEVDLVVYILQRGIEKRHVAVPFRYGVYEEGKAKPGGAAGPGAAAARQPVGVGVGVGWGGGGGGGGDSDSDPWEEGGEGEAKKAK